MYFKNVVFTATVCVIMNFRRVNTKDLKIPQDKHSFAALLNIVYPDHSKRICTGTIIHELVVLTTAQCFVQREKEYISAELTLSFVVIGTKSMYESGYEQYLAIEKVLFHPDFNGWTANVALVQTFDSMIGDRPGVIVPLVSYFNIRMDLNITVISWGKCAQQKATTDKRSKQIKKRYRAKGIILRKADHELETVSEGVAGESLEEKPQVETTSESFVTETDMDESQYQKEGKRRSRSKEIILGEADPQFDTEGVTGEGLEETLEVETTSGASHVHKRKTKRLRSKNIVLQNTDGEFEIVSGVTREVLEQTTSESVQTETNLINGRRRLSKSKSVSQQPNSGSKSTGHRKCLDPVQETSRYTTSRDKTRDKFELSVEEFGYVNTQTCKRLVERAVPEVYNTEYGNSIVCYSSEDHYITKEDSGAPAIQQGQMVAMTIGGLEIETDHVAVGLDIHYYWSWIEQNLP